MKFTDDEIRTVRANQAAARRRVQVTSRMRRVAISTRTNRGM